MHIVPFITSNKHTKHAETTVEQPNKISHTYISPRQWPSACTELKIGYFALITRT